MRNYTLGLYEKALPRDLQMPEKLMAAKEAGFDFLELSIDETDEKLSRLNLSSAERKSLVNSTLDIGIPFGSICLSAQRKYPMGSMNDEIRKRSMDIVEKAIDLAVSLGVRIIQLAGYDVYYEESSLETKERFVQNLERATRLAAKQGVILAFETMETPFMNTVEKAMHYISIVNSSYLQIYPDCGNLTNASRSMGHPVLDDIATGSGHMVAMHLKETAPAKFREIPFGTGHVDFQSIIPFAMSCGINRFVAELWYTGDKNWPQIVQSANQFLRSDLDKGALHAK